MTAWAEGQRAAALRKDYERSEAEQVPCPETGCGAGVGERCRNVHDQLPLEKQPAHWRRIRAAGEVAS